MARTVCRLVPPASDGLSNVALLPREAIENSVLRHYVVHVNNMWDGTMKQGIRRARGVVLLLLCGVVLSACYMPLRFDAEIEVYRDGYYSMIFDGYVAKVPLYDGLRTGKITQADETVEAEKYRVDLANDPLMKEVSYFKQGIYKVHWDKKGDILRSKFITFIRRNENMLSLRYDKTEGTIKLAGAQAGQEQRQQLRDIGLDMIGEIRVITDAKVAGHNATVVKDWPDKGPGFQMYVWKLPNIFAPSPNMIIQLH